MFRTRRTKNLNKHRTLLPFSPFPPIFIHGVLTSVCSTKVPGQLCVSALQPRSNKSRGLSHLCLRYFQVTRCFAIPNDWLDAATPACLTPCIRLQSVRRPLDRTQHCDRIGRRGARSCNFRLRSCIKIFESGSEISSNLRIRAPCLGVSRNKLGPHFTGLGLLTKRAIFFVAQ